MVTVGTNDIMMAANITEYNTPKSPFRLKISSCYLYFIKDMVTFQCILNLQKKYTGQISLDGQNIKTLKEKELAKFIAYIPQIHKQSFAFSVFDTVLMGTTASLSPFSTPKETQKETAMEALRLMGIEKSGLWKSNPSFKKIKTTVCPRISCSAFHS